MYRAQAAQAITPAHLRRAGRALRQGQRRRVLAASAAAIVLFVAAVGLHGVLPLAGVVALVIGLLSAVPLASAVDRSHRAALHATRAEASAARTALAALASVANMISRLASRASRAPAQTTPPPPQIGLCNTCLTPRILAQRPITARAMRAGCCAAM